MEKHDKRETHCFTVKLHVGGSVERFIELVHIAQKVLTGEKSSQKNIEPLFKRRYVFKISFFFGRESEHVNYCVCLLWLV